MLPSKFKSCGSKCTQIVHVLLGNSRANTCKQSLTLQVFIRPKTHVGVPPGCASATLVNLDNLNPITVSFKCLPYQLLVLHYMSITVSMELVLKKQLPHLTKAAGIQMTELGKICDEK